MKIGIIGAGYVGLVVGIGFSSLEHNVEFLDLDSDKLESLRKKKLYIHEPGLDDLFISNYSKLRFTNSYLDILKNDIIFICVPTPSLTDGNTDLSYIKNCANLIKENLNEKKTLVIKSTVPVGTNKLVSDITGCNVISNPEFLSEGNAVKDFLHPQRVIIGGSCVLLDELYKDFFVVHMTPVEAEITKYAANSMLALRISYMNLLRRYCDFFECDISKIEKGIGSDKRIGKYFLKSGLGFGGSCFPKDVNSLSQEISEVGVDNTLFKEILKINNEQINYFLDRISLKGKICVLGLSFKVGTDDIRESASIRLIKELIKRGYEVCAHDPVAISNASKELNIEFVDDFESAALNSDTVIIATPWECYSNINGYRFN